MQTGNTAFARELTKLVQEELAKAKDEIATGMMSHDEYKMKCGVVLGMQNVLGYFDEVTAILAKR